MEAAASIEAKKHGLRQGQDGTWTLALVLHPSDVPNWLLTAPMGQRLALVVAALNEEEEKPKERKRFDELPLSQQAALRCADIDFTDWLIEAREGAWNRARTKLGNAAHFGDIAAEVVRNVCGVSSRKELATNERAAKLWLALHSDFLSETGRQTERRG